MRQLPLQILPVLAALSLLAGCYAQVEDGSVSLTHDVCVPASSPCIPGGGLPLSLGDLIPGFQVDLGGSDLLSSATTSAGPVTLTSNLILNQAVFAIIAPQGADFSGVTSVELLAAPDSDPSCQNVADCTVLARYDRSSGGPAGVTLTLSGTGVNVIGLSGGSHHLTLVVRADGTTPAPSTWAGSVRLDMGLKARGSFP